MSRHKYCQKANGFTFKKYKNDVIKYPNMSYLGKLTFLTYARFEISARIVDVKRYETSFHKVL